jgi:hypothetical protein
MPSNGNTIEYPIQRAPKHHLVKQEFMKPSMSGSTRPTRMAMADSRALEVQQRQQTPGTGATPSFGVARMRGGSAVPSTGLSEFRGGDLSADVNYLLGLSNVAQSGAYQGQGLKKNMDSMYKMKDKHHKAGHELSAELLAELGAPSHKKLLQGLMSHGVKIHGAGWWDDLKRTISSPFRAATGDTSDFLGNVQKLGHEVVDPNSRLRGEYIPKAAEYTEKAAPIIDALGAYAGVPGAGTALATGARGLQEANKTAKAVGLGRRRRAPASASDGRRKRAEVVRKVMGERGVSMIEASRIVKAEGLY